MRTITVTAVAVLLAVTGALTITSAASADELDPSQEVVELQADCTNDLVTPITADGLSQEARPITGDEFLILCAVDDEQPQDENGDLTLTAEDEQNLADDAAAGFDEDRDNPEDDTYEDVEVVEEPEVEEAPEVEIEAPFVRTAFYVARAGQLIAF